MENDKKKPTFEPVSAEEAKKIRAFDSVGLNSGTECASGDEPKKKACEGKSSGAYCCWVSDKRYEGRCVWNQFAWPWDKQLYCSDVYKSDDYESDKNTQGKL